MAEAAAALSADARRFSPRPLLARAPKRQPLWIIRHVFDTPHERSTLRWFLKEGMSFGETSPRWTSVDLRIVFTTPDNAQMSEELQDLLDTECALFVENRGLDWGAWSKGLERWMPEIPSDAVVILMNSTIAGPVLPPWTGSADWPRAFADLLSDDVALSGISINPLMGHPHVQSMLLCMRGSLLGELRSTTTLFDWEALSKKSKGRIVVEHEVGLSLHVLRELRKNIACLIPEFAGVDWRDPASWPKAPPNLHRTQDPSFFRSCYGRTLHPLETLFFKINRDLHREPFMRPIYSRLGLDFPSSDPASPVASASS